MFTAFSVTSGCFKIFKSSNFSSTLTSLAIAETPLFSFFAFSAFTGLCSSFFATGAAFFISCFCAAFATSFATAFSLCETTSTFPLDGATLCFFFACVISASGPLACVWVFLFMCSSHFAASLFGFFGASIFITSNPSLCLCLHCRFHNRLFFFLRSKFFNRILSPHCKPSRKRSRSEHIRIQLAHAHNVNSLNVSRREKYFSRIFCNHEYAFSALVLSSPFLSFSCPNLPLVLCLFNIRNYSHCFKCLCDIFSFAHAFKL